MHRIFSQGRKVFISKPKNLFPLEEGAEKSFLMGGGIGVTPMIAFAHRLHALGRDFEFHYSVGQRRAAGYLDYLATVPWRDRITLHVSDEGTRADLDAVLAGYQAGWHVYACGPDRYIAGVLEAAERQGYPDEARHFEYFSAPETPDYENHPFVIKLTRSGREVQVPADKSGAEALIEAGIHVDMKCDDGICGGCRCDLRAGDVEHRDFVLSAKQRETGIILCQSRAAKPDGVIEIDL